MLNDPTKDQIPQNEFVGKDEGAKVTESAGNFSNQFQNQQGLIFAAVASKGKWDKNSPEQLKTNSTDSISDFSTDSLVNAALKNLNSSNSFLEKVLDSSVADWIYNVMLKGDNAMNKVLDPILRNKVVDKALGVSYAPISFANYVFNRIYNRSSFIRKLEDKAEASYQRDLANNIAKKWAKNTGAGTFAEARYKAETFDFFQRLNRLTEKSAEIDAKEWAKTVGASVEAEKEYASKLVYREAINDDFERLTRNEFKKKYPQIKTPERTDLVHKRHSVARLIKSIRGYRVPNDPVELYAFRRKLNSQLRIKKSLYWGAERIDGINAINRQRNSKMGIDKSMFR